MRYRFLILCLLLLTACGAPSTPTPPPTLTYRDGIPDFRHVFIIVMENKEQGDVLEDDDAPYFNELAPKYATADEFHAIRHPSLPNYLALTGGDTFGVETDCTDCFQKADNLASQITKAGRTWKAYMESMPNPCFVGDSPPLYRQKHNPFIYFDAIRSDPAQCARIVPMTQLTTDIQNNALPDFVWITPNMCSDTHDCPVKTGDAWLKTWVPQILATPAWQSDGVLFITYDEGHSLDGCCTYAAGGSIPTLVISPLGKPGFVSKVKYDHYSLLRTIETAWDLPLLGQAACDCSPLMADFFTAP